MIDAKEVESIREFEKEHKVFCQHEPLVSLAVEFSQFEIVLRENSIRHVVLVKCLKCKRVHDATDYDAW